MAKQPKVNHSKADDRIHRSETCVGTVKGGTHVYAQTNNSHPIESLTEQSSLRSERVYDWEKGEVVDRRIGVLEHAQHHVTSGQFDTVTSGRAQRARKSKYGPDIAVNPTTRY